jgi:alkanesulfonate monooxygenase SsuD/methylene tetrahydromethanopterin reductase-like flavin-dependent oxidoreductase (luciferase family)
MYALAQGNPPQLENHYEKLRTILDLLEDRKPQDPLYRDTPAAPVDVTVPQTWLLGSSGNSAVQAGRMGVGYSFAQFFTGTLDKSIFDLYKKNFVPSAAMPEKQISVAFPCHRRGYARRSALRRVAVCNLQDAAFPRNDAQPT